MNMTSHIVKGLRLPLSAVTVLAVLLSPALAETISVSGNRRVDSETVRSYFTPNSGRYDKTSVDQGVKDLYATGMFSSVKVSRTRTGISVNVVENNSVASVLFKGNKRLKSDLLVGEIRTKAGSAFNQEFLNADVQRIKDIYQRVGRLNAQVEANVTQRENGRRDVVFNIVENERVGINSIKFEGNKAFSDGRLRDQMSTTESNWLSWLKTSDVYDGDRLSADMEQVRRYYLKKGYADVRLLGSDVQLNDKRTSYDIKISVDEGEQYRFGKVDIVSRLPNVNSDSLRRHLETSSGSVFNAESVEKTNEAMAFDLAKRGYPFAQVRPRGEKDAAGRLINITYVVEEGPRLYVERINVRGNTRSRDYVVRREFDLAEGDAYNRVLIDRAERRLRNLGFFKTVKVSQEPGSAADRVVLNVDVEDQPTGEFSVAGGYSTADGVIGEIGVAERNFLGRGQYAKIAGQLGQRTQGIDFSFTEPYFMDQRLSLGVDLFAKKSDLTRYAYYENETRGGQLRLGMPLNDQWTLTARYQAYEQSLDIPATYGGCSAPSAVVSRAVVDSCGESFVSALGYTINYNTLDNRLAPTSGWYAEFKQDFAGLGGNSKFIRSTGDTRYYHDLGGDFVLMGRAQAGHIAAWGDNKLKVLDHFFLGPTLVRGFAPSGLGPRDISAGVDSTKSALGGTAYAGGTLELQFPFLGLPKELGMRGALFADAGTVRDYRGKKSIAGTPLTVWESNGIRSSVGAGLMWNSPLGPLRFDYAYVLSSERYDRKQAFFFSGGTRF